MSVEILTKSSCSSYVPVCLSRQYKDRRIQLGTKSAKSWFSMKTMTAGRILFFQKGNLFRSQIITTTRVFFSYWLNSSHAITGNFGTSLPNSSHAYNSPEPLVREAADAGHGFRSSLRYRQINLEPKFGSLPSFPYSVLRPLRSRSSYGTRYYLRKQVIMEESDIVRLVRLVIFRSNFALNKPRFPTEYSSNTLQ